MKEILNKSLIVAIVLFIAVAAADAATSSDQKQLTTQRVYLSGTGCDDAVKWDFFCTGGRQSGQWSTIHVPSCWELQGFGEYQYGIKFYGKEDPEGIMKEQGLYKHHFTIPDSWKGQQIQLVFEGVMTDAKVTVNGQSAGAVHHGAFYRFAYDITEKVHYGKDNLLEVTCSKESSNPRVNLAERRADYWNFGGIFRPVFLVCKPMHNIERVAIDAQMDGRFRSDVYLHQAPQGARVEITIQDAEGKTVGKYQGKVNNPDKGLFSADFIVKKAVLWSPEKPVLHTAVYTLKDRKGAILHIERQKFGFRTVEVREEDGIYINGVKTIFKGVCRHSFRPETGRTLSKAKNIEDVELIKGMNMNAVRLSHYPADPDFLDACDSLGLYVMCEISGWHFAHDTENGQTLVKEMVTRDCNHPSIVIWSNGNEGGFNYELEPFFHQYDIQNRVVVYPWTLGNGIQTKHYCSYGGTLEWMRSPGIFLPTEFLHGLYDGGHGAGLDDYWKMMMNNPRCAGGFLWDLADQGVIRTDRNDSIDCVGNYAADGIVGPHHEKEGSYFTIKEVWSPVQVTFNPEEPQKISVSNCYQFTNLKNCKFTYRYLSLPSAGNQQTTVLNSGNLSSPNAAHGTTSILTLPAASKSANALEVRVDDPQGKEVFTWCWPISNTYHKNSTTATPVDIAESATEMTVTQGNRKYLFSKKDGQLQQVTVGGKTFAFGNGPRLTAARRSDRGFDPSSVNNRKDAPVKHTEYTLYEDYKQFTGFTTSEQEGCKTLTANYKVGTTQQVTWRFENDGSVAVDYSYNFGGLVDLMGISFDYPEEKVLEKSWVGKGPYRIWKNRMKGPQYGFWHNKYNNPIPGESFEYPEFKGYFGDIDWMELLTKDGTIRIQPLDENKAIGVYHPIDGRDKILYEFPETGIAVMTVVPGVRNKVNATDLNGPSAQPVWIEQGLRHVRFALTFK